MLSILLKMKLLSLFIIASLVSASATTYSQFTRFSMELNNARVKDVFQQIETNSEFILLYNEKFVDVDRMVSVKVTDETVESILNQVFHGTGNSFKIYDRQIVILKKPVTYSPVVEKPSIKTEIAQQPDKLITGSVTDVKGGPLPGVSILVKGTTMGTITNLKGEFQINVPQNAQTLVISFMGMKSQEMDITVTTTVNVIMEEEVLGIDELVVVGYGTQRKVNLTGSVSTLNADELSTVSMPTLAQSMMGKTSGVFIKNVNGQPGDNTAISFNIRGFGSPMIIIDGLPATEYEFQQLSPNQIENFSILKDAAAAAVYGARAGNGVVLVTTKKGGISPPKFTFSSNNQFQFFTVIPDFVNSEQYARMENLSLYNEGKAPIWDDDQLQKFADGSDPLRYPDVDWWNASFRKFAPQTQNNISVQGGNEQVR